MTSKFGRHYPVLGRRSERDRLLFVAAAGLAFSLLTILVVVFNFRKDATAKQNQIVEVAPQQAPAALSNVTLLAPERFVPSGSPIGTIRLKEVLWPRNQVPEGAVQDEAEIRGMFAKVDIPANTPLQREFLTKEKDDFVLPVSPGNRAVSIEVDAVSGIEGHASPGTRVDVILTYYESGELTSKVIVENTRVLSLGGDTTPLSQRSDIRRRGRAQASRTITLEVTPEAALKIQTAKKLGSMSLIMRAQGDNRPMRETTVSGADLGNNSKKSRARKRCSRGTIRIDGQGEFLLNCDGSMVALPNSLDP